MPAATTTDAPDADELSRRAERFPGHRITWEVTWDHARCVAQALNLDVHPYVVIAASLDEVCAALTAAQPERL
jgi:hypothetical protein